MNVENNKKDATHHHALMILRVIITDISWKVNR